MAKRFFLWLTLVGIIVGTTWIFFEFDKVSEHPVDAVVAIPIDVNTIISFDTQDWSTFSTQAKALLFLLDEKYSSLNLNLDKLDSLRSHQEGLQELLDHSTKYLSFIENESEGENWIFTIGLISEYDPEFIQSLFPSTKFNTEKIKEQTIFSNSNSNLSWSITNKILYLSPNIALIKTALDKYNLGNTITKDSLFLQAYDSQGTGGIQIFSNRTEQSFYLQGHYPNNWVSYETRVNNGNLTIFGYEFNNEKTNSIASKKTKFNFPSQLIPAKSSAIEIVRIDNIRDKIQDTKKKLERGGELERYINSLSAIETNCQCEPEKIAFNRTNSYGVFKNKNHFITFINYPNFDEALIEYQPLLKGEIQEFQEFPIFELKYNNLYSTLLNQENLHNLKYFTYNQEFLFFTSKIEDAHWLINQWRSNNELADNLTNKIFDTVNNTGWYSYHNKDKSTPLVYPFTITETEMAWLKNIENKKTYNEIVLPTNFKIPKVPTNTLNISASDNTPSLINDEAKPIIYTLKANIANRPTLVTNHYTKEKEIFAQDVNHRIYLINNKGESLWSKDIEEEIQSPIRQIDVYRNGKLQLVFNTKTKIYCLDRNGKNVDGFPIKLSSEATSPLAIFDYDNKRKYRLVIGCEDNNLYNYTVEGKKTVGWKYKQTENPVIVLEHLRIKGRDYIFTLLKNNKIEILKRTGVVKFKNPAVAKNYNNLGYAIDKASKIEKTRMLYITTQGEFMSLAFSESEGKLLKSGFSSEAQFVYKDFNGDKKSDFIISDKQTLKTYSSEFKLLFEKTFSSSITTAPVVYKFNAKDYGIGVCTNNSQFSMLGQEGKLKEGYPTKSEYPITIGDLNNDGEYERTICSTKQISIIN